MELDWIHVANSLIRIVLFPLLVCLGLRRVLLWESIIICSFIFDSNSYLNSLTMELEKALKQFFWHMIL